MGVEKYFGKLRKFHQLTVLYFRILILLLVNQIRQTFGVNIECRFFFRPGDEYFCEFQGISIPREAFNSTITISGEHVTGMTNGDVISIDFRDSDVPFIVSEVFEVFPNMIFFEVLNSSLTHIQPEAFRHARAGPEWIKIDENNLTTIPANSFLGLSQLAFLTITRSQVKSIHPNAFLGLNRLTNLYLYENKIKELPPRVFRSLRRLRFLQMNDNKLTRLDGQLFLHNGELLTVTFATNNINKIERTFLDQNRKITEFNIRENQCADFDVRANRIAIISRLETCFDNFDLSS
jgi:hypothetical protein